MLVPELNAQDSDLRHLEDASTLLSINIIKVLIIMFVLYTFLDLNIYGYVRTRISHPYLRSRWLYATDKESLAAAFNAPEASDNIIEIKLIFFYRKIVCRLWWLYCWSAVCERTSCEVLVMLENPCNVWRHD